MRSLGAIAILSLQTEEDMGERGIDWEEKAALAAKLAFRSVPVRDFDAADLQRKLPECVAVLDRMLKAGHTVYLHCTAGAGRSPAPQPENIAALLGLGDYAERQVAYYACGTA